MGTYICMNGCGDSKRVKGILSLIRNEIETVTIIANRENNAQCVHGECRKSIIRMRRIPREDNNNCVSILLSLLSNQNRNTTQICSMSMPHS